MMISVLTGENSYEIRARRGQIIAEFREKHGADAVKTADGAMLAKNELPQLLTGMSLFAPEQLIVIDDASASKEIWEALEQYLPDASDVLLVVPSADKRTRTYKWLQKNAIIKHFELFQGPALEKWVQREAREQGIELTDEITREMIEFVGMDQWRLRGDVEKLSVSGRPVTRELIREVLIPNPQASAFELLDAALSGQTKRVEELLEGVRTHEDPYRFFGLFSNQIFAILVVAAAGQSAIQRTPDEIAKASGLHPFVVRKTGSTARRLSKAQRDRLAEITATTDMQLKSSGMDPWVLITAALKSISAQ